MKIKFTLIYFLISLTSDKLYSPVLNMEERKLYNIIMLHREKHGLSKIPLSGSLTYVAQTHVKDLQNNKPSNDSCNLHSWSSQGKWKACCYTDHSKAKCMWSKPRELTSYSGNGYEISYWSSNPATAEDALESWQSSPAHNEVILNQGMWNSKWNAIGIGVYGNYAVIWFGNEIDNK